MTQITKEAIEIAVGVKALQWVPDADGDETTSNAAVVEYSILGPDRHGLFELVFDNKIIKTDSSKEAVKSFAQDHYQTKILSALAYAPKQEVELPWRTKDLMRGLILFRTSNNAHGYTNVSILSERVDSLPQVGKDELANMMRNIADELSPSSPRKDGGQPVTLTYTNWRGETAERSIKPLHVWFGSTDWHPEPQWLLKAIDCEKNAERDFALKDFGGKDSGHEVEAVGEAAELARLRAIALDMQAGYVEATERAEEAVKAANALQAEVDRLRDTRPQPASTALVERLTSALSKAEAVLSIYADPTGYADADGNQLESDAEQHEGLLAQEALEVVRSALSSSQSTREGER